MTNEEYNPKVTAVIAAGGGSQRMAGIDKLFAPLGGIPVLAYSMLAFQKADCVANIVVTCKEENIRTVEELAEEYKITKLSAVTRGGESRTESVLYGIAAVAAENETDIIAVHDGARPFITAEKITELIKAASKTGAAILAVPVKDTVKSVKDNIIEGTPERKTLLLAQTPQAFDLKLYRRAVNDAAVKSFDNINSATDDSSLLEIMGEQVTVVEGDYGNIKITTPEDLQIAEALLIFSEKTVKKDTNMCNKNLNSEKENNLNLMCRIGHGYDVHRFSENRRLVLCGVTIPYDKGLLGHSDADVAVHAVMDALLGALALGDIGQLFPDNSLLYKDADSMKLLSEVIGLIHENGYEVGNLDVTIIAEKPKLSPYILQMRKNLASACLVLYSQVSIKATTEEGLGLAGAGISAYAVCILNNKS